MRSLPPAAARQCGVFTASQARAVGWTRSALRHAVSTGELTLLRRGVLGVAREPTGRAWQDRRNRVVQAAVAAVLRYPGSYASHRCAALLLDLPVLGTPTRPCLTLPTGHRGGAPGIHLHHSMLHKVDRGLLRGALHVSMPPRLVVDIARELGELAGVVTADAALRQGLLNRQDLARAVERARGRPGAAAARAMAGSADPRAESPLESRSRLAIRDHGLPAPWLQPDIYVDGRFAGRADFYWDEFGVVGEADGFEKYEAGWQRLRDEKRRQELLERGGLIVVRWGSEDMAGFGAVAVRLRAALARGVRRSAAERRWLAQPARLRPAS